MMGFLLDFIGDNMYRIDLREKTFGRLKVLKYVGQNKYAQSMWNVLCVCGEKKIVSGHSLTSGNTTSCGCRQRIAR